MSTLIDNLNYINSCKSDIKSAIEEKGVDMTGLSLPDYASAIGQISTGGGYTVKDCVERTYVYDIASISDSTISYIAARALEGGAIEYLDLPSCSYVGEYGVYGNEILSYVSMPNCTIISSNAFRSCYGLRDLYIPNIVSLGFSAFQDCSSLVSLDLQDCEYVGTRCFSCCSDLSYVDLGSKCSYIGASAFYGCTSLSTFYIRYSEGVCSAVGQLFSGTAIAEGMGSIYVPYSYLNDYKVTGGWEVYSDYIYAYDTPAYYLSFSDGLLYGNVSSISDTYIMDYQLPISSMDITAVSLPDCTDIGFGTFLECSNISEVYIPKVEGIGSSAFRLCGNLQSINLPSCGYIGSFGLAGCDLRIISAPVLTGIENNAIVNNKNLESVYFPELTYLGGYGLYNNPKLSYVSLPSVQQIGSNAFNTTAITAINLPYVTDISGYAFGSCSKLTTLFLGGETVVTLAASTTFNKAELLSDIFVPESLYSDYLWSKNWSAASIAAVLRSMPSGNTGLWIDENSRMVGSLTSIGSDYYSVYSIDSNSVYSVNLPLVLSIESGTFKNHQNLESYYMPYISSYPDELFYNTGITGLTFTESMILGNSVFKNCASLGWVEIYYANDILSIGSDVFAGCTSLETITVPYDLYSSYLSAENWSEYASLIVPAAELDIKFSDGLVYGSRQYLTSEYLNELGITADQVLEVSLPECIEVGSSTFKDHINLSRVSLPLCTTVYVQGFSGCTSLEEVYLPVATTLYGQVFFSCYALNSVTLTNCQDMSAGCFRYCSALSTLTLPSASNISANAFADCVGMTSLVLPGGYLAKLAASTAFNNNNTYIYVPDSMVADYQASTNWSRFAGRILSIQ